MHPAAGKRFAGVRFALQDLVLVMGEHEVYAPAVDVERFAQVFHAHDRALDVPAGASVAPRARPTGLVRLGRFPQREVAGTLFSLVDLDTCAGNQLVNLAAGELPVRARLVNLEIHAAVRFVCESLVDQSLDHSDDVVDMFGGVGHDVDVGDAQCRHVLEVVFGHVLRDHLPVHVLLVGAVDDLVVDVRDVEHQRDVEAPGRKVSLHGVEDDGADGVSDVTAQIHGGAA